MTFCRVAQYLLCVNRYLDWGRRNAPDLAIAALTIGTVLELALTTVHYNKAIIPFALAAAPVLFFRHRFPLGAPTACFALLAAFAVVSNQAGNDLSFPFFCALAAMAIFGAAKERRVAYAGIPIAFAALAFVVQQFNNGLGEIPWIGGFFIAAWLAGFILSARSRQTAELRERAARLELDREAKARAAVTEERARIARELHDVVGHSVSVMTVQASGVRRLLRPDQEREREALLIVEQTGREALAEMRKLVGVLRRPEDAPALAPQPSLKHLDKLVEQVRESGLAVDLKVEGEATNLPASVDLAGYRLVQEGLTNTIKHAQATRADVLVRYGKADVELVVADNGTGNGDGGGSGHGLVGIRERVSVVGGSLEAGPRPGGGFEVRARLPVNAD
jgi:signal transduction histidine kinase